MNFELAVTRVSYAGDVQQHMGAGASNKGTNGNQCSLLMGAGWPRKPYCRSRQRLRSEEVEGVRGGHEGCFRERGRCPGQDREKEQLMCSRLPQETGRKDHWLVGGRGEAKKRDRIARDLVSLAQDIVLYLRTKGKPWQSFKQGRDLIRSVSPTETQGVKLSVLSGLATWRSMSFGFRLASAQKSLPCPTLTGGVAPGLPTPSPSAQ